MESAFERGDLAGALADLGEATTPPHEGYAWAWGQKGETHRLYAKRYLSRSPASQREFNRHIQESIRCFTKAISFEPSSWSWAHLGATYSLHYLNSLPLGDQVAGNLGLEAFAKATAGNATYSWALVFNAYLLGLMRAPREQARAKLAEGQLYDYSKRLLVLRGICELLSYDGKGAENEAAGFREQALRVGWMALQENPEDLPSRYVVATTLQASNDPNASAAIDDMRHRLDYAESQIRAMRVGLELAELRKTDPAALKQWLQDVMGHLDGDALALLFLDPNFEAILGDVF